MLSPNNEKKPPGPKRFYKEVVVDAGDEGYAILIDGKPVKTPMRKELIAENKELAEHIAKEWRAQETYIDPNTMPLTQILNTRLDKMPGEREGMTREILKYFDTDLVCYYTDAPQELYTRQKSVWNNAHLWFAQKSGESLQTTQEIAALKQKEAAHDFIKAYIQGMNEDRFIILQMATPLCGSIILAAAFCDGALDVDAVMKACFVEEDYKAALYNEAVHGGDPHLNKKRDAMHQDLQAARIYMSLSE